MEIPDIYCLSYNKPARTVVMTDKLNQLKNSFEIYSGVGPADARMIENPGISSCMLGHMDMIAKFYNETTKEYGIFCEDDILIHKEFGEIMPKVITSAKNNNLDVVMIGYLMNYHIRPEKTFGHVKLVDVDDYAFYSFHEQLWGAQMYLISRSYAKHLLETYDMEYARKSIQDPNMTPFSADWIITKKTARRALLYPPICIENGDVDHYEDYWQRTVHKQSYTLHVNSNFV